MTLIHYGTLLSTMGKTPLKSIRLYGITVSKSLSLSLISANFLYRKQLRRKGVLIREEQRLIFTSRFDTIDRKIKSVLALNGRTVVIKLLVTKEWRF